MNSKEYIANAIKTESVPASLSVDQIVLHQFVATMITVAELANQMKRKLFYGKPLTREAIVPLLLKVNDSLRNVAISMNSEELINQPIPQQTFEALLAEAGVPNHPYAGVKLENLNIRLLHSALGIFSESGELLEALQTQFETGKN